MLGDDILIGDQNLAEQYKKVITSLGCEFSPLKTHESKYLCEFAKRYVYRGEEITPFPVSALGESMNKYHLMVNLLCELKERGWNFIEEIPLAISEFYGIVLQRPSRFRKGIEVKSQACERLLKVMRGVISASDALNSIARSNKVPIRDFDEEEGMGILQSITVECFAESNPLNQKGGKPLGLLATDLLIGLTGCEPSESEILLWENPHFIPILQAYGQVEEAYMKLSKEAFRIDTEGGGDWPLLLKAMALPLDDTIFVERSAHLISRASALLGKKVLERFELILTYYPDYYDPSKKFS